MTFSKLLALGATLFVSTSLALPAPEAASACSFSANVDQICNHGYAYTSISIPQIHAGKTTLKPNGGNRFSLGEPFTIQGLAEDLVVGFQDDAVTYDYGDDKWDGHQGDQFTCKVGAWSTEDLDCKWAASRYQSMDCTLRCETEKPLPVSTISARDDSPFEKVNSLSTYTIEGDSISPAYAHGYCSFKLQLMQQCLNNPEEKWHNEMLGNIFSIQDNAKQTVVSYPAGAGRIDNRIKWLTGMGDGLHLVYQDNQVYFKFDGGLWSTDTKDDGKAYGLCHWGTWSRGEWGCEERFKEERRVSDITCVFRC